MGKAGEQERGASVEVPEGTFTGLLREVFAGGAAPVSPWDGALQPGNRVGRFELLHEIGRGGFGSVWEARDTELKRNVAFKAVRVSGSSTADERAIAEAETAAHLSHPNVVTLFDAGRCEHGAYLVMELLRGKPLGNLLVAGAVPPAEALRIATQVARGLAHAHARGVIHRDLTPGNVFVCEDGTVKILDLGIARALGRTGPMGGTPGYWPPERRAGLPEDARGDVFSLGMILHRMLTGHRPAVGNGAIAEIDCPEVPGLARLVSRMLSPDPERRPRDAGEVLADLERLASPAGEATGSGGAERPGIRRRAGIAIFALLLAGAGGIAWWKSSGGAAAVASVSVRIENPVLVPGGSSAARALPETGAGEKVAKAAVAWRSSDGAVATVDAEGRVVARSPGTTSIEATVDGIAGSAPVVVNEPGWQLAWSSDLTPPPGGYKTRNGAIPGQAVARVQGRTTWYQTSDWSMLFVPVDLPETTDLFAVQADFHLPPVTTWKRGAGMMVFTDPGTTEAADLTGGRGVYLTQSPGASPVFYWGVTDGWTTEAIEATGPVEVPITGGWKTLRIEGSRAQCWLRALLDGKVIHTSTRSCSLAGSYVVLSSKFGSGNPVNAAWSNLRVFRGTPVDRVKMEIFELPDWNPSVARGRVEPLDAEGNVLGGRTVAWETSDPSIATVDEHGTVTAHRKGRVTLTVRVEGKSASAELDVTPRRSTGAPP